MSERKVTNDELLAILDRYRGENVSGETLASSLGITRAAVWKRLERLRALGYEIEGAPKRGYSLSKDSDFVSEIGVRRYLAPSVPLARFVALDETGSTNSDARELAVQGAPEWTVVVANSQSAGRGRFGRSFFSPKDVGVYLSLILRPDSICSYAAQRVTTKAAVAACRAIETVSSRRAEIKWVNDVLLDGKKVCGILTEASLGLETDVFDYVALGVGINAYPPFEGYPADLSSIVTSVYDRRVGDGRNRLVAEFLNAFYTLYCTDDHVWRDEYRARSCALGREGEVRTPSGVRLARALDVDEECRLIVEYESGERAALASGEVSIRMSSVVEDK